MIKLIISFFMLVNLAVSNPNLIEGKIIDRNTREELAGVRIISDCDTVYSDFNGCFKIKTVSDTTNLQFNLISYESENLEIIKIEQKLFVKN